MDRDKNKKHIDELFKNSLSTLEMEGLGESWLLLQKSYRQKNKRKFIFRISSVFIILIIISCIAWYWYSIPLTSDENKVSIHQSLSEHKTRVKESDTIHNLQTISENPNIYTIIQNNSSIDKPHHKSGANHNYYAEQDSGSENRDYRALLSYSNKSILLNTEETENKYQLEKIPLNNKINSNYAEYGSVINADGTVLYFTSRRPIEIKTQKNKTKTIETENIYVSYKDAQSGEWSAAQLMPAPINQPGRFNSIIGLSNDGQRMLLYRDDVHGNGDIYESILNGNTWSNPQKLPEPINSPHLETSASISPDGNTIYFVSNRPGGQGKLDIWYCTKGADGKWGMAINLGSVVNSPEDEEGVFMHPDGKTLYFSSRGHGSIGGYDIFKTTQVKGKWTTPEPLKDINDKGDDVYFVLDASGQKAYYSTLKSKESEKDIYEINFVAPKKDNAPQLTLFKGEVYDKETKKPLEAQLTITDLSTGAEVATFKSNSATGKFMLSLPAGKNYGLSVDKKGYLFYSENFNIPEHSGYKEINQIVFLDPLKTGSKIVLNNIFYEFNKATLTTESQAELNKLVQLMNENSTLKIELSAHTDSRGSDEYNLKLSEARARSCLNYLIQKGIKSDRIIAKGYGEAQPVISDKEIEKLTTEEEKEQAYQKNRRTEIKIIEN